MADTKPDVFIIESVGFDEEADYLEGRVLYDVLRMCGKSPHYFLIRTRRELEELAARFSDSDYRYLHVSCHGSPDGLQLTLDFVPNEDFAAIFADRLKLRRLVVSACQAGNAAFVSAVRVTNRGMHSILSPADDVQFDHAVALWTALYVKCFSVDDEGMKGKTIGEAAQQLSTMFGVRLHFARYTPYNDSWVDDVLVP